MISAHAYPWDVLGDAGFADRVIASGADAVRLAVTYHSTRAATPLHPTRRFVEAPHAALYRPVRPSSWAGRRLVPVAAQWTEGPDPAGSATHALGRAGIPVDAWLVLAHNTRLGTAHPDLTVTNCFGESYPYALCPASEEVRDHCATLAAEALHDLPVRGVVLESAGQMGAAHLGCHEKTDDAYPSTALRALSVCCCPGCQRRWQARGLEPGHVQHQLRRAVDTDEWVPEAVASELLAVRQDSADELRGQVIAVLRQTVPGASITLAGHPDPWATGSSPGLTPRACAEVDAVQVPCWSVAARTADLVRTVRAHAAAAPPPHVAPPGRAADGSGRPLVDAYVTVLPPVDPEALPDHVRRLRAAGADRLSLYHLGLASRRRQPLLAVLAKEFRA
ncbi:hypothetical protein [Micromonospora deserti]|uniref:Alanine-rich protein n=1 Tax=Micromonospora deserti TaxID=2070366 RepID=A0A2W2CVK3_9ACTN|nr:hypothetical protein [Micromonospora deserti]PZG01931.1 hypothetical protein C1I99_04910 [Micromonospora deserti]